MNRRKLIGLISVITFQLSVIGISAQTQFNLIGGQQFEGKIVSESSTEITYETSKKRKTKQGTIQKERLFSTITNGVETIHYSPDVGHYNYTREDMRYYVYGQQDAYEYYTAPWAYVVSAGVATGTALWLGSEGSVLLVLSPFLGAAAGSAVQSHRASPDMSRSASYLKEPAYVLGFRKTARSMKIFAALKMAVVGTIAGGAAGLAIHNQNN